ncbi:hypothetical protein HanIR_Chr05g0228221 [Helianthus annuus]|nr:hypothetical protein HanIR_Chr05g0228221 [Helianthus annuus]
MISCHEHSALELPNQNQGTPDDKQMPNTMLPLKKGRMHVKALFCSPRIYGLQEDCADEGD